MKAQNLLLLFRLENGRRYSWGELSLLQYWWMICRHRRTLQSRGRALLLAIRTVTVLQLFPAVITRLNEAPRTKVLLWRHLKRLLCALQRFGGLQRCFRCIVLCTGSCSATDLGWHGWMSPLRTRQQRCAMYLVGMQLLLFTVRVTLIRVIAGGPHQHPVLLPDVTNGNIPNNLNREQYFNFLCKTNRRLTSNNLCNSPVIKLQWVENFFNLFSAGDSNWIRPFLTSVMWLYSTNLLQLLPWSKRKEYYHSEHKTLLPSFQVN